MGYVYLILEVDKDGNEAHKIGITKNDPYKRLKQLQTGNSRKISIINLYESNNYKTVEKWLHKRYECLKTESENEFFTLLDEDVINFQKTCKKLDDTITLLLKDNPFFK